MFCFYPIVIVGIGGCWSLPLPSSLTLVWGLQDDGQNQTRFLCLVPGVYTIAGTVWLLSGNQSQSGIFQTSRLNAATVRMSSNRQYLLQYGVTRPHILVPLNHSSPFVSKNLETFVSSERPTAIYWPSLPNTLFSSWELSSPSSVDKAFIPSSDGHLDPLNPSSVKTENVHLLLPSLHLQDLGVQISHIVSPQTLHFSALPTVSTDTFLDAVKCFLVKTEHDDLGNQEIISGRTDHPFCNEEQVPVELGHHIMQNVLFLLSVKIITFKLIIFDLLMTGAAMVETCQKFLHSPEFTEQND